MKRIRLFGVFAALFAFSWTLTGQVVNSIIRTADAAYAGLSGAGVAMPANPYALEENPAAMSLYDGNMAAGAGFGIINPSSVKMQMISAAGFYKLGQLALGLDAKSLSYEPYSVFAADGRTTGEFTPREFALTLGASYLVTESISVGLNAKMYSVNLAEDSSTVGLGIDAAAMYSSGPLCAGVNIRNIASPVMDVRAGAAYSLYSLTVSAEGEYLAGAGIMAALGAQYAIKEMVFVRGGFHYGNAATAIPSYGSLGAGLKIAGINLDAAVLLGAAPVSGTTLVSLGYSF